MLHIICTRKEKTRVFLFFKLYKMVSNILKSERTCHGDNCTYCVDLIDLFTIEWSLHCRWLLRIGCWQWLSECARALTSQHCRNRLARLYSSRRWARTGPNWYRNLPTRTRKCPISNSNDPKTLSRLPSTLTDLKWQYASSQIHSNRKI